MGTHKMIKNTKGYEIENNDKLKIGIALSGGGFRASVFHIGVFETLAKKGFLDQLNTISTVSGGSLTIGLIFKLNNNKWPTDKEYLENILPKLKKYFTEMRLAKNAILRLFLPLHWLNLFSRANIIAHSLKKDWNLTDKLSDLPDKPTWEINATTNETGKNWRFSKQKMGDYKFGYIMDPNYDISNAIASSTAFPGLIGRFKLNISSYQNWHYFDWDRKIFKKDEKPRMIKKLHLSDGGLYNNLGEEALINKLGETLTKDINFLIVSDATKALKIEKSKSTINALGRTLRLIDIAMDQIKMLRVRALHNFFEKNPKNGLYIQLGQYHELMKDKFDLKMIKNIKTSLFALSHEEYDELTKYGACMAQTGIEKWYDSCSQAPSLGTHKK
ncbi:MAG: patatin-like phospholipase family protein [Sulfurospirillum sp.]|nr:patatin-like phospholipase family protein [Sulfurospirillum sp.]